MNVVTLNCQRGYKRFQLRKYLGYILDHGDSPEFIMLQEVNGLVLQVINDLIESVPGYKILQADVDEAGTKHNVPNQLLIIYKDEFKLIDSVYYSFKIPMIYSLNTHGYLIGEFEDENGNNIQICSLHLVPGPFRGKDRQESLLALKNELSKMNRNSYSALTIIGGDFNSFTSNEVKEISSLMEPEYNHIAYKENSYNSFLYEGWRALDNYVRQLNSWGLSLGFQLDHFFTNISPTSDVVDVHIDQVAVSDHHPVAMKILDRKLSSR